MKYITYKGLIIVSMGLFGFIALVRFLMKDYFSGVLSILIVISSLSNYFLQDTVETYQNISMLLNKKIEYLEKELLETKLQLKKKGNKK